MATLSSIGIGSGIDANSIITQLVAIERQPIDRLKTAASDLDTTLSAFGKVQSNLDALRNASRTLADASTWQAAKASSGDATAVGVTVSSGTSPGSYAVQVNNLATAQMNAMNASVPPLTSASTIGQGTLRIDIGRWADDLSGFTSKDGSTTVDIVIGPGEDSLAQISAKINNTAGLGVRASVVNDAGGARLVLQSRSTGADNGFRVQVVDDDGVANDDAGLSRLAYDPQNGAAVSTRPQAGRNASATINGLSVESATNQFSNVIDGVSLTLGKVTTSAVDVTVSRDNDAMRASINTFVSSYNDLVKLLRDQTKYDPNSKAAGPLQGDRTAIGILAQARQAMSAGTTASSVFARLSDIGLGLQTDGTLKVTGTKLDAALGNVDELQKFFTTANDTAGSGGLGYSVRKLMDGLLGSDGSISSRQDGLRRLKTANADRQQALEDRVSGVEKRLRAQYQALDTNMARLSSLQNYVSQQIQKW